MSEQVATEEKVCKICKKQNFNPYVSEGEKQFFADNNLSEPKMCPECRRIYKAVKRILEIDFRCESVT